MAHQEDENLRATVLTKLRDSGDDAAVYLTNGVKLTGKIVSFDASGLMIRKSPVSAEMFIDRAATATITKNDQTQGGQKAPR